jgi:small multidrug resistance pump
VIFWVYLVLAIVLEVAGTTSMKLSEGFTKFWPAVAVAVCYGVSIYLLALALKRIDVSVAYAVWSGVGTALVAAIGVLWFREPLTALKLASLILIVAGVVGLNLGGARW